MAASEITAKEFTVTRTLNAPRDLVWKAWTDAEALEEWWGPKGCAIEVEEFDASPGGIFHYAMRMPDGGLWWALFRYDVVERPSRLAFISSFSNASGEIVRAPFSEAWPKQIYNVVTFIEESGRTTVTLQARPIDPTAEESAAFAGMLGSMQQGFGGTFDQLAAYLATKSVT